MNIDHSLIEPLRTCGTAPRPHLNTVCEALEMIDLGISSDISSQPHWQDARLRLNRAAMTGLNLDRVVATQALESALEAESWLP